MAQPMKLTPQQVEEIKKIFSLFDRNGDGYIEAKEISDVMRGYGLNPTQAELQEIIDETDADGSGTIDFPELLMLIQRRPQDTDPLDVLTIAFSMFDVTKDGFISELELRRAMLMMGDPLTDEEYAAIMKEVDVNGDGKLDYAECARALMSKSV